MKSLQYSDLDENMLILFERKHKEVIMCIVGNFSKYAYDKLLYETLWRVDLNILTDLEMFFAHQELYEFSNLIKKAIELKTIVYIKKFINIPL